MSSLTRAQRTMSLEELSAVLQEHEENYRTLRKSIMDMKSQVDSPDVSRARRRSRLSIFRTMQMYNDGITIEETVRCLEEFQDVLEYKHSTMSDEIERLSVKKDMLRKSHAVAKSLLEMIEKGETQQAIEAKMSRDFSGDYKWKAALDAKDVMQVYYYLKNFEVAFAKTQAISTLKRIVELIAPPDEKRANESECSLKAIEAKLDNTFVEQARVILMLQEVEEIRKSVEALHIILEALEE